VHRSIGQRSRHTSSEYEESYIQPYRLSNVIIPASHQVTACGYELRTSVKTSRGQGNVTNLPKFVHISRARLVRREAAMGRRRSPPFCKFLDFQRHTYYGSKNRGLRVWGSRLAWMSSLGRLVDGIMPLTRYRSMLQTEIVARTVIRQSKRDLALPTLRSTTSSIDRKSMHFPWSS